MLKDKTLRSRKSIFSASQVIALGFLGIILAGAIILCLPFSNNGGLTFTDSLYMSTSAVCLTGLATVSPAVEFTYFGQVIFLLLIQVGGLGFTTITSMLFILIRKKISYKERLMMQEALNQDQTKGIVRLTKNVTLFTLLCEGIGALILAPYLCIKNGAIGIWQGIFTSISAFCNAGFDLFGSESNLFPSLIDYNSSPLFLLTVSALIIVGGLGFTVVANVTMKAQRKRKLNVNTKTVLTCTAFLLIFGTVFTFLVEHDQKAFEGMNFGEKLLNAFFQSVTTRTAGYAAVDQASLSLPTLVMSMIFMFIGGGPASTAGGIKVTTVAVIVAILVSGLKNRDDVVLFKRSINRKTCIKAITATLIGIIIVLITSTVVMLVEQSGTLADKGYYSLTDIMYETFSAFGTTGLSTGGSPYYTNFSKYMFILAMYFGRVGTITAGLLFFSNSSRQPFRYPEENIMIG